MLKFSILRPVFDNEKISTEDQREYLSGVGMLLFLVMHSRPDIFSATWEMLKANDSANPTAFHELIWVIRYVNDTKNFGLKFEPTRNASKPCKIVCFDNSNYAGDPVNRWNVSGFILYVLGVPDLWQSKKHLWFNYWEVWKFQLNFQSW